MFFRRSVALVLLLAVRHRTGRPHPALTGPGAGGAVPRPAAFTASASVSTSAPVSVPADGAHRRRSPVTGMTAA